MRAVHLLTNPSDHREARSVVELRQIIELVGYNYTQIVNPPYKGPMPPCRECNDRPFKLTQAHYGCYLAHKEAIAKYLEWEGLWIFECDAVFTVDYDEAARRMERVVKVCKKHEEIVVFTLGYRHNGQAISRPEPDVTCINQWIETHAYFIPPTSKPLMDSIYSEPWDCADYNYTIRLCDRLGAPIAIFNDRPICVQGIGNSLIDGKLKGTEPHFRNIRYSK